MKQEMTTVGSSNIMHWWTLFAMDVIDELCFRGSFRLLEEGKKTQYAEDIAEMGSLLPLWDYLRLVENNPGGAHRTLFSSLVKGGSLKTALSPEDLTSESQSYITTGTDTTTKLLKELDNLPNDFTHLHVRDLPYMNLVIEETLRLYGASQAYSHILYFFPAPPEVKIVPRMGARVINVGKQPGNSGLYRPIKCPLPGKAIDVVEASDTSGVVTYKLISERKAPLALIDTDLLKPVAGYPKKYGDSDEHPARPKATAMLLRAWRMPTLRP
ncbi:hypothetical protein E0Z10_g7590 [Xylaria hypoxylon]|uniref:Uncharacterized protein n=1 Tax=Xylaria hypoxylon TaxID=37992 RepID=A0A4Z0YB73_9PEZI|nr:hypothetical protein E0Z10_g7590 [Xylaria hypoxylon]